MNEVYIYFQEKTEKLLLSNVTFNHWNYSPPLFTSFYVVFCNWAVYDTSFFFLWIGRVFIFDMHAKRNLFILKASL